jgi:hypothetical protein
VLPQLLKTNGSNPIAGNLFPTVTNLYSLGTAVNTLATVYAHTFNGTSITAINGGFESLTILNAPPTPQSATNKQYVDAVADWVLATASSFSGNSISNLVGDSPLALNTLSELSTAVNNNPNFGAETVAALESKAPLNSPSFTGNPIAPTVPTSDVSNALATTAFVRNAIVSFGTDARMTTANVSGVLTVGGGIVTNTNNTTDIGSPLNKFNTVYASTFVGTNARTTTANVSGVLTVDGGIVTNTNNTTDIGSSSNKFNTVHATTFAGTAIRANYADLAENYVADKVYEPGTVLVFGGDKEVTESTCYTHKVAGVVSTNPAYLMNSDLGGETVVAIALQGRCPVKVYGPISKGDCLVACENGRAKATSKYEPGTIIGKSLEDFHGDEGVIEVSIGRC